MIILLLLLSILFPFFAYPANVSTYNGVSDASISTVNGVSGASIDTLCGATYNDGDAACSTSTDSLQINYLGSGSTGGGSKYACVKHVLASNITITEYIARYRYDSGDGTVTICLLPHNAGTDFPDGTTCITGTDSAKNDEDMGGTAYGNKTHTLGTPVDVDAGTYWICNIEGGSIVRSFEYYTSAGKRGCYGDSACDSPDVDTVDGSIDVYGCTR